LPFDGNRVPRHAEDQGEAEGGVKVDPIQVVSGAIGFDDRSNGGAEETEVINPLDDISNTMESANGNGSIGWTPWIPPADRLNTTQCSIHICPSHMTEMYALCLGVIGELWYADWMSRVVACVPAGHDITCRGVGMSRCAAAAHEGKVWMDRMVAQASKNSVQASRCTGRTCAQVSTCAGRAQAQAGG
jgi:hypothetical protein